MDITLNAVLGNAGILILSVICETYLCEKNVIYDGGDKSSYGKRKWEL
jgi:hypothetical protein